MNDITCQVEFQASLVHMQLLDMLAEVSVAVRDHFVTVLHLNIPCGLRDEYIEALNDLWSTIPGLAAYPIGEMHGDTENRRLSTLMHSFWKSVKEPHPNLPIFDSRAKVLHEDGRPKRERWEYKWPNVPLAKRTENTTVDRVATSVSMKALQEQRPSGFNLLLSDAVCADVDDKLDALNPHENEDPISGGMQMRRMSESDG